MPDRVTVLPPAELLITTELLRLPTTVGANRTVNVRLCPGCNTVLAAGAPTVLNGAAGVDTDVIVSAAAPVLLTVMVRVALDPRATVPKATDVGLTVRVAVGGVEPESAIVVVPAELAMTRLRLKVPAAVGVNWTVPVSEPPAGITVPTAGKPIVLNGAVGWVKLVMVSGALPVLAIESDCVCVVPTATDGSDTVAGVTVRRPEGPPTVTLTSETACCCA